MRVEIYGCVWEQRIANYKAPKAAVFGPGGSNIEDSSYDGREDINGGHFIDGLGQLVDGILGDDPRISSSLTHWVGWTDRNPLTIIFQFNELRLFNSCTIYSANAPVRGIEVFKNIRVWFSVDGKSYEPLTIEQSVEEKSVSGIISIVIPLRSKSSKFVKLELEPRSKWLLISEITFDSRKFVN